MAIRAHSRVAALGELTERLHLLEECESIGLYTLGEVASSLPATEEWLACWTQLGLDVGSQTRVPVLRAVVYPGEHLGMIPMMHVAMGEDVCERPFADTSGAAAHTSRVSAMEGAAKEFIERQYLCASWLAGECEYLVDLEALTETADPGLACIIDWLEKTGDLRLICLCAEPSVSVIAAIHTHEPLSSASTGFSFGIGCAVTPLAAVRAAVYELFSGVVYDLVNGTAASPAAHAYESNCKQFTHLSYRSLLPDKWLSTKKRRLSALGYSVGERPHTEWLKRGGFTFAIYCASARSTPGWWVAKVISPSYFVNIDVTGVINTENPFLLRYLAERHLTVSALRRHTPICLP